MNFKKNETVLVSACLNGYICRWHGKKSYCSYIKKLKESRPDLKLISVCPEELGGLPTPRLPVKRLKGRVFETCEEKTNRKKVTGNDITDKFIIGAKKTLTIAKRNKIKKAILCKWSPSCDINGITGKLLYENEIEIFNTW